MLVAQENLGRQVVGGSQNPVPVGKGGLPASPTRLGRSVRRFQRRRGRAVPLQTNENEKLNENELNRCAASEAAVRISYTEKNLHSLDCVRYAI